MKVSLQTLSKHFGAVVAVDNIDLDIQSGEFVAFLGPSGCGKTTTLLMIAGIYKPTTGYIRFDEHIVNLKPPKDRNIGMVFQSYALYPHMTAYENITFPLKIKKMPARVMEERAKQVAGMMGISHLLSRKPGELSGGQQQRVALGRALAKQPDLLLFDEPLSNLDARLRLTMRAEIKRLQLELGITSIYVTHDQIEAMTMADRIAVIQNGQLQAYCSPDELYDQPRTMFIAGFVGNPPMNFVDLELSRTNGAFHARREGLDLVVPPDRGQKAAVRQRVIMGVRPEDVTLATEGAPGEVYVVEPLGRDDLIDVQVGDLHIHALADPALELKIGDRVNLNFNPDKLQFFDPETERSLLW